MQRSLPSLSAAAFVAIAAVSLATPSRAEIDYPWCSLSSTGQSGLPSCRFSTQAQCQASVAGSGWCQRNSRLVFQEQQATQRRVGRTR
jgi:Protein of unknown function (DUF3551)